MKEPSFAGYNIFSARSARITISQDPTHKVVVNACALLPARYVEAAVAERVHYYDGWSWWVFWRNFFPLGGKMVLG